MADLTITPGNIQEGTGAQVVSGTAGAVITAGQTVYLDSSDNTYKLADANSTAAAAQAKGVALNSAPASGQPITVQYAGNMEFGAIITEGEIYVVSATAGGIAPEADLASGHRVTIVGVGVSTTEIKLISGMFASGAQL